MAWQQQGLTALVRLDLTTWKEVARVPLDKTPRGLELTPDGRRVFFTLAGVNAIQVLAAGQGPGELAILDTANNTLPAPSPWAKPRTGACRVLMAARPT